MSDNFEANAGSGGQTFASDDIGGVQFPRSKLVHGANGTNDGDVSKANPLPVGFNTAKDGSGTLYAPLVDSDGHTQVDVLSCASHAVTNAGTFAVQVDGAALTSLQLIDDAVFADDAAFTLTSSKVSMSGAVRDDALSSLSAAEGDAVPLRVDANGAQWVVVSGTVTVGSHAVTNAGTFVVQENGAALTALQVMDDWDESDRAKVNLIVGQAGVAAGAGSVSATTQRTTLANDDPGVVLLGTINTAVAPVAVVGNGAAATAQRVTLANDSTGVLATVTTVTTVSTLTGGGIAHDSGDSGNPHKIGMKATAAMTGRTLVAADDRTDLFAGLDGVAIVRPHAPLEDLLSDRATNTDGASTAMAGGFAAPGANIRLYLTTLIIANSSATAVTVDIRDGTAGSVLLTVPVPADTGGVVVNLPVPLKFTANTALAYDASAAVSTLTISVLGFKSKAG